MRLIPLSRGYVICSYPRSGSNLLLRALASTHQLGNPQEFFNHKFFSSDPGIRAQQIALDGTTENGVYGLKIFCHQFARVSQKGWAAHLPNLSFVHLERRDALGQAISYAKAAQTKQWASTEASKATAKYDARAIEYYLAQAATDRARWQMYFARNEINPLWLTYEDVVADLPDVVRRVAALVHVDVSNLDAANLAKLKRQGDTVNDEWRTRYVEENGNLDILDWPAAAAAPASRSTMHRVLRGARGFEG